MVQHTLNAHPESCALSTLKDGPVASMTAKLKYGLLCDGTMRVLGKSTYQGVFTAIHGQTFPAGTPEATLCFKFSGPVGPHIIRIQLVDSQGKALGKETRQPIECRDFIDNEVNVSYKPLVLPKQGFYVFQIFLDEDAKPFGEVELQGIIRTAPKQEPQGGPQ